MSTGRRQPLAGRPATTRDNLSVRPRGGYRELAGASAPFSRAAVTNPARSEWAEWPATYGQARRISRPGSNVTRSFILNLIRSRAITAVVPVPGYRTYLTTALGIAEGDH